MVVKYLGGMKEGVQPLVAVGIVVVLRKLTVSRPKIIMQLHRLRFFRIEVIEVMSKTSADVEISNRGKR